MENRPRRTSVARRGRRIVAWLATLSLCLNTLLPPAAKAMAVHGGQPVIICPPDGYKTIQFDQHGAPIPVTVPVPARLAHEGHDCTLCYSLGHCAAPAAAMRAALGNNAQDAIRPADTPPHASTDVRGGEARGPPRHA